MNYKIIICFIINNDKKGILYFSIYIESERNTMQNTASFPLQGWNRTTGKVESTQKFNVYLFYC